MEGLRRACSERVGTFLEGVSELRIVAEDTDLRVGVGGRRWMRSRGLENFPDGEIFTGPVETSVEGTIRFTYPAIFQGREVDDVRLRFEGGEVVEASASRGEDLLREMIAVDDGARRAGEFAFGLNDAVTSFTREDPVRREDRRHDPPRARHGLSGDRERQSLRPALGYHLRPAQRRRGLRRR